MLVSPDQGSMANASGSILLGDIGGTHARFALWTRGELGVIENILVADHPTFADAAESYLARHGVGPLGGAVLAGAGPVKDRRCALTNSSWMIDGPQLEKTLRFPWVEVINDFEALAWALPDLGPADLLAIGGGTALPGAPAIVVGPGTGLGVACLAGSAAGSLVIGSEGGHCTLPATSDREEAIIRRLRSRMGHVSAERVLSGGGLINLYQTIADLEQVQVPRRDPSQISRAGIEGNCLICFAALEAFCGFLGAFAGDMVLAFGARGGAHIAGGIVPHFAGFLASSKFRERFEAKGRLTGYVAAVPSCVITHDDPAFVGLAVLARQLAASSKA